MILAARTGLSHLLKTEIKLRAGRRPACRKYERNANVIVLAFVLRIADNVMRDYRNISKQSHLRMVHHIAHITFFGHGLLWVLL